MSLRILFFVLICVGADAHSKKLRIVAFGDSLTAGFRLTKEQAYPARLEEILGKKGIDVEVLNAGVSGDTSSQALRRIEWTFKKGPFDWVILCIGANDGLRGQPLEQLEKNLRAIILQFKKQNTQVLLMGMKLPVNLSGEYRDKFEKLFEQVAKTENVYWGKFILEGVAGIADLQLDDQIHPNEKGQAIVAQNVAHVFLEALKKSNDKNPLSK